MPPLNRRAFLSIAALSAAASASACASSSAPARTSDVPGAAPAPPTPAPPAAGTEMGEWDDLIAAARAEGALSLLTLVGSGYRTIVERFQQAFPGIAVQRLAESSARVWLGQVREGQRAGRYEFDLAFV